MNSLHLLLNEAERDWRKNVKRDFPLRSDTPVIKRNKTNGNDWEFSTDLKKIFATISNDEELQRKFKTVVTKHWKGEPEELAKDTLHYLLFHELYHPIEAPFSTSGKNNDSKGIHQAIRRGLLQAEPKLSPLEQMVKVQASQNGVKDFILDNRFALDNIEKEYVQEDIIPVWDLLELQDSAPKTNFYTITRLIYGMLYGPKSTHNFFEEKSGEKGLSLAEQSLSAIINSEVTLPSKNKPSTETTQQEINDKLLNYVGAIRDVFSGKDRYRGIERMMGVLGPYVEKGMPQERPNERGENSGSSPQSILQDLLNDMDPEEQQEFIQSLAQEDETSLEQSALNNEEMRNLDVLATHEFYKRNHPQVKIIGGEKIGEKVVIGKQEYWDLKKSTVLNEGQLGSINLGRINMLQRKTRLPWLMDLKNGTFRLNEYVKKQRDIKDINYIDAHLEVPDTVEFYLDSSGSMFNGEFLPGDGSRWDMLSHVLYGFADALNQGGKQINKQSEIRIHNFAMEQLSGKTIPVEQFWKGDSPTLGLLFKPENGYQYENLDITDYKDGQKRTYVIVTDGQLMLPGRTQQESRKMKNLAQNPNNQVLLFEIGGTYDLGKAVRNNPNIVYHQVHDKDKMLQAGLEVLLSK